MSIALFVVKSTVETHKDLYVPIATQEIFKGAWTEGATAINARWIPLFETGIEVSLSNKDEILKELSELTDWLHEEHLEDDVNLHVLKRIENLIAALENLLTQGSEEAVFIG